MRAFSIVKSRRTNRLPLCLALMFMALALLTVGRWRPTAVSATGEQQRIAVTSFSADAGSLGTIPDGLGGCGFYAGPTKDVTFTVTGMPATQLTLVAVALTATHTRVGDLAVTLHAPGNIAATHIFVRTGASSGQDCGDDSNLNGSYSFFDSAPATPTFWQAAAGVGNTESVPQGGYRATTAGGGAGGGGTILITPIFANVQNPNGTWILRFWDGAGGEIGAVTSATLTLDAPVPPTGGKHLDFDGDGKADFAVFRPSSGVWYVRNSSNGALNAVQWGIDSDVRVQGQYDADNKVDHAIFRPSLGRWYVLLSATGNLNILNFGTNGDVPVPEDYNGDTFDDFAVFRPFDGHLVHLYRPCNQLRSDTLGTAGRPCSACRLRWRPQG